MTEQQAVYEEPMGPEREKPPRYYHWWGEVPWTLASKSQLTRADLPREPAGPVRGYVAGRDFRGRDAEIALYDVAESRPTKASGVQLAAADARRSTTVRVCTDCGAQGQLPLTERQGRYLCAMCWRIATVVNTQVELRERRLENGAWARERLAGPLAIVWVELVEAEPSPSGRRRPPLAARVHVVDEAGRRLLDVLVRLAGPRTKGAPADAVEPAKAAVQMKEAFAERARVTWGPLGTVVARMADLGYPAGALGVSAVGLVESGSVGRWPDDVASRFAQWRGELDPATGELRKPWPPGSADRLWLCLRRMAETADGGRPGESAERRREALGWPQGAPAGRSEGLVPAPAGSDERDA
ncbi:hypothetical protein ACH41E_33545 [Streptomyces sp. NPDC020412]|uniref:hypothetical protein n=1 Tax=Streptomyces sp. NPDC020412 TaxID=3365073 RepID=UPI0037BA916C